LLIEEVRTPSRVQDEFIADLREKIGRIPITKRIFHVQIDDKKQLELLTIHGKYFQNKIQDIVRTAILKNWIDYLADMNVPRDEETLKELIEKNCAEKLEVGEGRETLVKQEIIKLEVSGKMIPLEKAIKENIRVSFDVPVVKNLKLSELTSKHVNRIVVFDATVVGVESQKLIVYEVITTNGETIRWENYDLKRDGDIREYKYHDVQNLLVEESDDNPTDSKLLRKIITKVYDWHVGAYEIGAKIKIIGYYQAEENKKKDVYDPFVDALTLHRLEEKAEVVLTPTEIDDLYNSAKANPDKYLKDLTQSVCPTIYENHIPKLAVLLSFIGGSQMGVRPEDRKRSNISVLLVGNPGTGKSEILKWARQLSHKGVYVDAPNASARGLLYGQEEFEGRKILRAGVMIRFKKVLLDELDKMKDKERHELNTAIEQQIAPYHKTPFDVETPIDVSVIAACNPNSDRWIDDRSIMENMKPLESMIVSRCILIKMQRSANTSERFTHIVKSSGLLPSEIDSEIKAPYTVNTLAGMVNHCSKLQPSFTNEAFEKMRDFIIAFEKIEQGDLADMPADTRKEVDLIRVATAVAKLLFKPKVDIHCIDIAMDFYRQCMESVGMSTESLVAQSNLGGELANKDLEFWRLVRNLSTREGDFGVPLEGFTEAEILEEMSESSHWPRIENCRTYWERVKKSNEVYEFKPGWYKKV